MVGAHWFTLHWNLAGGARGAPLPAIVFGALIIVGMTMTYSFTGAAGSGGAAQVWMGILTGAQGVFLLLLAPGAVRKAVLRDFQAGMMESHRLTPQSSLQLVLSYIFASPLGTFLLYGMTIPLMLLLLLTASSVPNLRNLFTGWLFLQIFLAFMSFSISSIMLLISLATQGKANVAGGLVLGTIFGGWMLVSIVPGLAVLLGFATFGLLQAIVRRDSMSVTLTTDPFLRWVPLLTVLLQFALACICVAAACRKIRRPEEPTFGVYHGSLLLLTLCCATIVGVPASPLLSWIRDGDVAREVELIASLVALLVVALIPTFAAATTRGALDLRRPHLPAEALRGAGWFNLAPLPAALAITLTFVIVLIVISPRMSGDYAVLLQGPTRLALIAASAAALLTSAYQWSYLATFREKKIFRAVAGTIILLLVLPVAIDLVLVLPDNPPETFRAFAASLTIAALSPIGTFMMVSAGGSLQAAAIGVGVQVAAAAALAGAAGAALRRGNARVPTPA